MKYPILLFLLLSTFISLAQDGQDDSVEEQGEVAIDFIHVADISSQAELLIEKIDNDYLPKAQTDEIQKSRAELDSLKKDLESITRITLVVINSKFPYRYVESFAKKWNRLINRTIVPEENVKEIAEELDVMLTEIRMAREVWERTKLRYDSIPDKPVEIIERMDMSIDQLNYVRAITIDSLKAALKVQNDILDTKLAAQGYASHLDDILKTQFSNLVFNKNKPIWSHERDSLSYQKALRNNKIWVPIAMNEGKSYLKNNESKLYVLGLIFTLALILILWMRRQLSDLKAKDLEEIRLGEKILQIPISTAFLFIMMYSSLTLVDKPLYASLVSGVIFLLPFIIVTSRIIIDELKWNIYILAFVLLLVHSSKVFILGDYVNRYFMLIVSLGLAGNLYWLRKQSERIRSNPDAHDIWYAVIFKVTPVFFIGLLLAIVMNIIGYVYIANLITEGILFSIILAVLFGSIYVGFKSLLMLFLNTKFAQKSRLLELYKRQVFEIIKKVLKIAYVYSWLVYTASAIKVKGFLIEIIEDFLTMGFDVGDLEMTVGSILNFLLILFVSWAIAVFVKAFLQTELLGRFDLPRGIPMAVGSLTNYAIIFIGFFTALSSLGFDLQKLGLLAGALGVGIGFGLQNIVSNFISGLILVFERPITAGDIVTVDGIEGEVIAIGIRASKIKQYNGSELIVPNSDLISKNVVNWTLSDKRRRIKLVIQTNTKVNPEKVIEWMEESIQEISGVLKNPPAKAYFENVVDQSYQFYLLYWVSGNILATKNEVNVQIIKNLKKHKVSVSVQRKLEIVGDVKSKTKE